jgi:hypothetical protein
VAGKRSLEIFLSSDQEEFRRQRRELSRRISSLPFLVCTPLETRGAAAENVIAASLRAVRDSDIYLGVFGAKYSDTTAREYREALRTRKPCYNYVKKVRRRDRELKNFVQSEIKGQFKYHEFSRNTELYSQVVKDLEEFLFRLLREGLETIQASKLKVTRIETQVRPLTPVSRAVRKRRAMRSPSAKPNLLLSRAQYLYARNRLLEATVLLTAAVETALRWKLRFFPGVDARGLSTWGGLLNIAARTGVLKGPDLRRAGTLSHVRSRVAHEGRQPSKEQVSYYLTFAEQLLQKLE